MEVTNPNIIVIDKSFEFTSMDMLEIKLKDMFLSVAQSTGTELGSLVIEFTLVKGDRDPELFTTSSIHVVQTDYNITSSSNYMYDKFDSEKAWWHSCQHGSHLSKLNPLKIFVKS